MICQALLSYLRGQNTEQQIDVVFETETKESAVMDMYRWVQNRHLAIPDYFTELLVIKISEYHIGKVDTDGALYTLGGWPFYEWKSDFPYPFDGNIKHGR